MIQIERPTLNIDENRMCSDTILKEVSQEHTTISQMEKILSTINFGDIFGALPVYSCLTADLTQDQETHNGEK